MQYQIVVSFKTNPNKAIINFDNESTRNGVFQVMCNYIATQGGGSWHNDDCFINLTEVVCIQKRDKE